MGVLPAPAGGVHAQRSGAGVRVLGSVCVLRGRTATPPAQIVSDLCLCVCACTQARLLYHESARVDLDPPPSGSASTQGGVPPSHRRLELLHQALRSAVRASELSPGSLSSAALRATLLVNLLVEESALQGGLAAAPEAAAHGGAAVLEPGVPWHQLPADVRCEDIKREFKAAIADCLRTLEHPTPLSVEPVITIADQYTRTCDPCCLVSWQAALLGTEVDGGP